MRTTAPVGAFAMTLRARQDAARLGQVLHSFGYYQGSVAIRIGGRALDSPGLLRWLEQRPAAPPVCGRCADILRGNSAEGRLTPCKDGGAKGSRTPDLLNAIQALSQLSYGPVRLGGGI